MTLTEKLIMSDYYGDATIDDWTYEEIFNFRLTEAELKLFDPWKESIEGDIESWMCSDDGYGNEVSWRSWGRGFETIPDKDDEYLEFICTWIKEVRLSDHLNEESEATMRLSAGTVTGSISEGFLIDGKSPTSN